MTLGEKIRKFRTLTKKTQRQLGELMGFKTSTADVRINQYETNRIKPKDDIIKAISDALNTDISALSDINISSPDDLIHVLFELEDTLPMSIERNEQSFVFKIECNNRDNLRLTSYLNFWYEYKIALSERNEEYQLLKSHFIKEINQYTEAKKSELNNKYSPLVKEQKSSYTLAKTTSDITRLLCNIIESGYFVSVCYSTEHTSGIRFDVQELLSTKELEAEKLFANFLIEIERLEKKGFVCPVDILMLDKNLTISYYWPIPSFSVICSQISDYLDYYNTEDKSDFSKERFAHDFNLKLEQFYNNVEDEISFYKK